MDSALRFKMNRLTIDSRNATTQIMRLVREGKIERLTADQLIHRIQTAPSDDEVTLRKQYDYMYVILTLLQVVDKGAPAPA